MMTTFEAMTELSRTLIRELEGVDMPARARIALLDLNALVRFSGCWRTFRGPLGWYAGYFRHGDMPLRSERFADAGYAQEYCDRMNSLGYVPVSLASTAG